MAGTECAVVRKWGATRPVPVTKMVSGSAWRRAIPRIIIKGIGYQLIEMYSRCSLTHFHFECDGGHLGWFIIDFVFRVHRQKYVVCSAPSPQRAVYTIKKGMRLMCSHPSSLRYRQTPLLERITGEHISRLKICQRHKPIAYTTSESKMLTPPANFWRISMKGLYRNAFLAYSLLPRVSDCKNTKISRHSKKKFHHAILIITSRYKKKKICNRLQSILRTPLSYQVCARY